jgi:hypothetical protein
VAGLTLLPFGASILAAFFAWELITGIATVWRMVAITFVWIATFAAGTQLFWKAVEALAPKRR